MEIQINDLSHSEKEMEVSLTYEEIKDDLNKEVQKQAKNIQIPGFRKGKVPSHLIKKMYGDALEYEASEKTANNQFWKIIKEKEINPLGQPVLTDMKFEPGQSLSFKVKFEVVPVIEVKDYTGNEIEIPDLTAKDDAVEAEVKQILKSNSTKAEADQVGDNTAEYTINVELVRVDEEGNPVEGIAPQVMDIDLSNDRVMKDIPEKARGKKIDEYFTFSFNDKRNIKSEEGEEKEVEETYNYKAVIKKIEKILFPELNEEFIKKVTRDKASNEEELRTQIKTDIQAYLDEQVENITKSKLISTIVEKNDFTPPHTLVHNFLDDIIKRDEADAKKQGYKSYDKEAAKKSYHVFAEKEVKWYLIKEALIEKESLEISDDDLTSYAEAEGAKIGLPVDKMLNYLKSSNYKSNLLEKKLFDMLKEKNTINKVDPDKYKKNEEE